MLNIEVHESLIKMISGLMLCYRSTFGMGMCIPRSDVAFSDPTFHGKMFAAKYTGSNKFLVYKPWTEAVV